MTSSELNLKKKILAVSVTACLLIFFADVLRGDACVLKEQERLSILSKEEREDVKELFDHFFFFDGFAYTLFGTKPMSIGRLLPTQKAENGWRSWEKIQHSFASETFILRKSSFEGYPFILVANLEEIERIYQQNKELFDREFQGRMTLEELLACLKEGGPLFDALMHHNLCLGVLLGYGVHNAELFARNELLEEEEKIPLEFFSNILHPVFYIFSGVLPMQCACDPSTEETQELKKRYTKERRQIIQMARKKPLFVHMLDLL